MKSAKLVCVDSKLVQKEKDERESLEREAEQLKRAESKVVIKMEPGLPVPVPKKEEI